MKQGAIDPIRLAISVAVVVLICLWYAVIRQQITLFGAEDWLAATGVLIYLVLVPSFLLHRVLGDGTAHAFGWEDLFFSACIIGLVIYGFLALIGRLGDRRI